MKRLSPKGISLATALAAAVLLAAILAFGASLVIVLMNSHRVDQSIQRAGVQARIELCRSIDADHNRQRAEIIRGEHLIYTVPSFKTLIATPEAERVAYRSARQRYYSIRKTRPAFCSGLVSNPVKPFPPLSDFQKTPPDRKAFSRGQSGGAGVGATATQRPGTRRREQPQTPSRPISPQSPPNFGPVPPPPPPEAPQTPPAPQNPQVPPRVCVPAVGPLAPICLN